MVVISKVFNIYERKTLLHKLTVHCFVLSSTSVVIPIQTHQLRADAKRLENMREKCQNQSFIMSIF